MGLLLRIKRWLHATKDKKVAPPTVDTTLEDLSTEQAPELSIEEPVELSEEEQQLVQIKQLLESSDLSNHQLAAMFMQGLELEWDEGMYALVSKDADKMTFWATQELPQFTSYFTRLVITPGFFSQYSEIAAFAEILPLFSNIEELKWEAKHYWNQHPIITAAAELPKLKRLYVEGCRMNFLPTAITSTQSLEELYLSGNKLKDLPTDFEQLTQLRYLDLSNNHLSRCPRGVYNLKRLETLRLHENPIIHIEDIEPRMLGRLYKLSDLQLPPNIAENHLSAFKDWLPDVNFKQPYWTF